jgi:hypothetical protein
MATEKQIAANRQNATSSTGPRTDYGKRRSRRNAMRHGLTAETVIDGLEDPAAYKALERAIHSDYSPRSNFELQLVGRLVSLLWRLRRAVAIESGLLSIQTGYSRKQKGIPTSTDLDFFYRCIPSLSRTVHNGGMQQKGLSNTYSETGRVECATDQDVSQTDLARSFLRLANINGPVFDRLGRYELSLWRQTAQIILLLNMITRGLKKSDGFAEEALRLRSATVGRRRVLWPPFVSPR